MESTYLFLTTVTIQSSMAVLFATLGEIVTEKSGILNLGVEGMMLMGAMSSFAASLYFKNPWLGVTCGLITGAFFALIHAFFTIGLKANQVICGLSLTIFGMGLSSFLGRFLIGKTGTRFLIWHVPILNKIPLVGPILFNQTPLVYLSYIFVPLIWVLLYKTNIGLSLRAVGENPTAADVTGISVVRYRYLATIFGGMMAGLGGSYLSLFYTPGWKENMTAGQGWIAIAMVIFSTWNPFRAVIGSLMFGGINALQYYFQASGITIIPNYILMMLPYIFTLVVLFLINQTEGAKRKLGAPASLGVAFEREL